MGLSMIEIEVYAATIFERAKPMPLHVVAKR